MITDYTVDGDSVTVPEAVLKANVERFANWKAGIGRLEFKESRRPTVD